MDGTGVAATGCAFDMQSQLEPFAWVVTVAALGLGIAYLVLRVAGVIGRDGEGILEVLGGRGGGPVGRWFAYSLAVLMIPMVGVNLAEAAHGALTSWWGCGVFGSPEMLTPTIVSLMLLAALGVFSLVVRSRDQGEGLYWTARTAWALSSLAAGFGVATFVDDPTWLVWAPVVVALLPVIVEWLFGRPASTPGDAEAAERGSDPD